MHASSDELAYYQQLALKWQQGTITAKERALLEEWYNSSQDAPLNIPYSFAEDETAHEQRLLQKIMDKISKEDNVVFIRKPNYKWWAVAASLIFVVTASIIWWKIQPTTKAHQAVANNIQKLDIPPGQPGAVLHLSNGATLVLDSLQNGQVALQGNVKVMKENGELKYIGNTNEVIYNDVVTNKGRQWKMTLPDGTKVWLNAASSIHYPVSFTGGERVVEITGEVYFDVVHKVGQPFKVKAGHQIIEDIGTVFNINAYSDEPALKTTLVQGSIKVGNHIILSKPGQQAIGSSNNNIAIKKVNANDVTAWINGQLSMDNISLKEFMRQLSRWYDVDVEYRGNVSDRRFGGLLDRNSYLSDIINVLNHNGIHVKLEGKKMIVSQ